MSDPNLPILEFEDVPLNLDALGKPQFCKERDEAFFASFAIGIKAESVEDWKIVEIYMGTQRLRGETYRRFATHFEDARVQDIYDHVVEHLPAATSEAAYEAKAWMREVA